MKFRFDAAESDQLPSRDRRSGDVPSRFTNYFKRTMRTVLISAIKKMDFVLEVNTQFDSNYIFAGFACAASMQ
ncbi:hypothetical protein [Burkholderia ubonensis]|uniref:hypothetical protein n=1 Tax=Burkholderia ubonensis TaxID=101571 RepID=UPI000ABAC853|nr:hypothetical protein [Burkholderia ubonensis]